MSLAVYPQGQQQQRAGTSAITSVSAPTGGLNTRDSLDSMDPTDALVLDNFIPRLGKVEARKGYEDLTTGIAAAIDPGWSAGDIETLISFTDGSSEMLIAAMDGGIARVDTGPTALAAHSTYSNNRWQWVTFADTTAPDNPKILAINNAEAWTYDGSSLAAWTWEIDGAVGDTEADYAWIHVFKNRVFMGKANSRNFVYGQLGKIPGTAAGSADVTTFPLEGIRGAQGNILFMASMTRDTGSGPDDYAVFVTDLGQLIVYAGTDPTSASDWALVGVYEIPRPIPSRRAHANLFGDVVIATELDYVFLSAAIQTSGAVILDPSKMTGALQDERANFSNYGWQMLVVENEGLLVQNIPRETNGQYIQHVFNVQTRAASTFSGLNFSAFAEFDGKLYGAGNDAVYRVLNGLSDDVDGSASPIPLHAQTAWNNFGTPDFKHFKAVRPFVRSDQAFDYEGAIGADYVDPVLTSIPVTGVQTGELTYWGDQAGKTTYWGDDPVNSAGDGPFWSGIAAGALSAAREWRLYAARGNSFCFAFKADLKNMAFEWLTTDYKAHQASKF